MPHVALLGDSMFDNLRYTSGRPDVITHLRAELPATWQTTLCAVDGATTGTLPYQFPRLPADADHLVLSIGGNDVLRYFDLLQQPDLGGSALLDQLAVARATFQDDYAAALDAVLALDRPTVIPCTIYDCCFPEPESSRVQVALAPFNDVILRTAFARGLEVIEMRLVCTETADYANPIEPSGQGGLKIARAITRALGVTDATGYRTSLRA